MAQCTCGAVIERRSTRGRMPRYCSDACRQREHRRRAKEPDQPAPQPTEPAVETETETAPDAPPRRARRPRRAQPDDGSARFGDRGGRLYEFLSRGLDDLATLVLAEECARMADRLDAFEDVIGGRGVLSLMRAAVVEQLDFDEGDVERIVRIEVKVDNVVGEARQTALALRHMLTTLSEARKARPAPQPKQSAAKKVNRLDELKDRRARRLAGSD